RKPSWVDGPHPWLALRSGGEWAERAGNTSERSNSINGRPGPRCRPRTRLVLYLLSPREVEADERVVDPQHGLPSRSPAPFYLGLCGRSCAGGDRMACARGLAGRTPLWASQLV